MHHRSVAFFYSICVVLFAVESISAQTLQMNILCETPLAVNESSGLENGPNGCFWTMNDSDNPSQIFCIDTLGGIERTVSVIGDPNTDWEDLAKDDLGNLYIGNFGNNELDRQDLRIVKIPSIDTCAGTTYVSDTISFSYPDQYDFPPSGTYGNFDMEAFFWYQDSLHLFSKDRSNPSTGYTKHYTLPTTQGTYTAILKDSLFTDHNSFIFSTTAADISEDGQSVVLLNTDRIWLCRNYTGTDFFGGMVSELMITNFSQKEGICFRNGHLYISDERSFGLGGMLYRVHPDIFVTVDEKDLHLDVKTVYDYNQNLVEINVANADQISWELFSTNGKLIQTGTAENTIQASTFKKRLNGLYAIVLRTELGSTSMLIKL